LFSTHNPVSNGRIEMGTVGWEDEVEWAFKSDDDGMTLIRVQLYRGRDYTQPLKAKVGQGPKILCCIDAGLYRIPPKGARVYVALPAGMEDGPGAGIIFAMAAPSPNGQLEKDRIVMDFGPDAHVIIKGKSVTLSDYVGTFVSAGETRATPGTPGVTIQTTSGTGACFQPDALGIFVADGSTTKSILQMTTSKVDVMIGGTAFSLDATTAKLVSTSCYVIGGGVYLGAAPSPATQAVYGPLGITGLGSTSVFISP